MESSFSLALQKPHYRSESPPDQCPHHRAETESYRVTNDPPNYGWWRRLALHRWHKNLFYLAFLLLVRVRGDGNFLGLAKRSEERHSKRENVQKDQRKERIPEYGNGMRVARVSDAQRLPRD